MSPALARRVSSLRGTMRARAAPVLFTGFENVQSQRRPEKPRVASVHLRPRPVALPHLRRPLPVLGDGTQTHRACARRKHATEHVRILQGRSLAAKETPMILPPRPIVEPEIADLSDLNSTTMRSDRGFASLWPSPLASFVKPPWDGMQRRRGKKRARPSRLVCRERSIVRADR